MPFLVKVLRTGLGLTSEAIHAARDGLSSSNQPSSAPCTTNASDTAENAGQATVEAPAQTEYFIDRNIGHQQSNSPQSARDPPDYLEGYDHDEAIWQLDDVAESVRPRTQTHDHTMAAAMAEETPDAPTSEQEETERSVGSRACRHGGTSSRFNVFLVPSSFLNAGLEIRIADSCVRTHLYWMIVVSARMCFCGFWNTWIQLIMLVLPAFR